MDQQQVPIWAVFSELAQISCELDKLSELPEDALQPQQILALARCLEWLCRLWLSRIKSLWLLPVPKG
jgi:hypothetical protein